MTFGIDSIDLGLEVKLVEPVINREASTYIINNYDEIVKSLYKNDNISNDKAIDLLHDVYISIVDSEDNGNCFDMEYGTSVDTDGNIHHNIIDVSQFVYGRIKLYSKNAKYRTDIIEEHSCSISTTKVFYTSEIDKNGNQVVDKNGEVRMKKCRDNTKTPVKVQAYAASFNDGVDTLDDNDTFQKGYALASIADSTDDIAEILSIRDNLEYCIDFCELHDVKIINVFKNIDRIADMLSVSSRRKKSADSVFSKLTELVSVHDEFADSFKSLMNFSSSNREMFNQLISTY